MVSSGSGSEAPSGSTLVYGTMVLAATDQSARGARTRILSARTRARNCLRSVTQTVSIVLCPTAGARADEVQSRDGLGPPTAQELRMMGANTSISFKKQRGSGLPRPLTTLPPFVPRLFIEDCMLNNDKFKGFDAAGRDLTAASKTLKPSVIELQAGLMIADVTGFTQLTEILSKRGGSKQAEEQRNACMHVGGPCMHACMWVEGSLARCRLAWPAVSCAAPCARL